MNYELEINFYNLENLVIFNCGFYTKVTCEFLYFRKTYKNDKNLNTSEHVIIFIIIDQIKVSREPLKIGHCHFCIEGHLKLCLQSL